MNAAQKILFGFGIASLSTMTYAVDDYSVITAAVGVGGLAVALIAMGALKAGPNVAKWGANKLASFFK
jgi:hypothetical protein